MCVWGGGGGGGGGCKISKQIVTRRCKQGFLLMMYSFLE